MSEHTIGIAAMGKDSNQTLSTIQDLERRGIQACWLTTGGSGPDALTLFGAAAPLTSNILMGTAIIPTWPRHPVAAVQQVQVISQLAPGRFRLGVGPTGRHRMEQMIGADFGASFNAPLSSLRDYITIVKGLLHEGAIEYHGQQYQSTTAIASPIRDVPVMASALRPRSFKLCGEITDGAITWVCPAGYLKDQALPSLQEGARIAGRETPPLIAHVPVAIHEDREDLYHAIRTQFSLYPTVPAYQGMFTVAGYPEVTKGEWSDRMIDNVAVWGSEETVATRLNDLFDIGISELIISIVPAGKDHEASRMRTLEFITQMANSNA
jgi:alkanesulfonate monooxygenase SsuD/methylene tetrahydromethanopterin reductase-like flavin-dependent oxidoreductase (luciferase family)